VTQWLLEEAAFAALELQDALDQQKAAEEANRGVRLTELAERALRGVAG
jgi:hypothetical protein